MTFTLGYISYNTSYDSPTILLLQSHFGHVRMYLFLSNPGLYQEVKGNARDSVITLANLLLLDAGFLLRFYLLSSIAVSLLTN